MIFDKPLTDALLLTKKFTMKTSSSLLFDKILNNENNTFVSEDEIKDRLSNYPSFLMDQFFFVNKQCHVHLQVPKLWNDDFEKVWIDLWKDIVDIVLNYHKKLSFFVFQISKPLMTISIDSSKFENKNKIFITLSIASKHWYGLIKKERNKMLKKLNSNFNCQIELSVFHL